MWIDYNEKIFNDEVFLWLHVRVVDLGGHCGQWQTGLGKYSCSNQDACYQKGLHGKLW